MNKVVLACGAWGNLFVDNYINYILPNHMTCLKQLNGIDYEYLFYTTDADATKIMAMWDAFSGYVNIIPYNIDYLNRTIGVSENDIYGMNGMVTFPQFGVFKADTELIHYIKGHPMTRGYAGTTAVPHNIGTSMILQVPIENAPNIKIMTQESYPGYSLGLEVIQTLSMRYALSHGASVFILSADCIYSANTFSNILKLADSTNKRVFFVPPFRVNGDIKPHLKNCDFSSRSLVNLSMNYLHLKFRRHLMDYYTTHYITTLGYCPSTFWWKFKDSGFLIRTFHMHPIFFNTPSKKFDREAIDQGGYLSSEFSRDDIYVITDSDVGLNIDLDVAPSLELIPLKPNQCNPPKGVLSEWAARTTHNILRELMRHPLYIHGEDLNSEWETIKLASDKFVTETYGDLLDGSMKTRY